MRVSGHSTALPGSICTIKARFQQGLQDEVAISASAPKAHRHCHLSRSMALLNDRRDILVPNGTIPLAVVVDLSIDGKTRRSSYDLVKMDTGHGAIELDCHDELYIARFARNVVRHQSESRRVVFRYELQFQSGRNRGEKLVSVDVLVTEKANEALRSIPIPFIDPRCHPESFPAL
jgi:hypothetical protein